MSGGQYIRLFPLAINTKLHELKRKNKVVKQAGTNMFSFKCFTDDIVDTVF